MNARMAILRPLRAGRFTQAVLPSPPTQLATRASPSRQLLSQARYSSSTQKSATGGFYKTFTRPVFKTALLAIFTYQVIWWAWTKLEQDEIKVDKTAEVERLEHQVKVLTEAAVTPEVTEDVSSTAAVEVDGKKKSWYRFW